MNGDSKSRSVPLKLKISRSAPLRFGALGLIQSCTFGNHRFRDCDLQHPEERPGNFSSTILNTYRAQVIAKSHAKCLTVMGWYSQAVHLYQQGWEILVFRGRERSPFLFEGWTNNELDWSREIVVHYPVIILIKSMRLGAGHLCMPLEGRDPLPQTQIIQFCSVCQAQRLFQQWKFCFLASVCWIWLF